MNSPHTYTHKPYKMSAPTAYISETRTVPKNCLHLTTVCVFIEPETLGSPNRDTSSPPISLSV